MRLTQRCIHGNGRPSPATVDGHRATLTTAEGTAYKRPDEFFTPSTYPEISASVFGGTVAGRYPATHPQAYVVDTTQLDPP